MTNAVVKQLTNKDCGAVINLVLPIQQQEFGVPVTLEGQPDLLDLEGNYNKTGGAFWGALVNGSLAGTIALIATGHNAGVIRKMFVKKEYRGKEHGVAQLLLNTLLQHSRQMGIQNLFLGTVEAFKAAHRFYEKNGFTVIAKNDLPPYFPFMPADTIFYHLSLQQ